MPANSMVVVIGGYTLKVYPVDGDLSTGVGALGKCFVGDFTADDMKVIDELFDGTFDAEVTSVEDRLRAITLPNGRSAYSVYGQNIKDFESLLEAGSDTTARGFAFMSHNEPLTIPVADLTGAGYDLSTIGAFVASTEASSNGVGLDTTDFGKVFLENPGKFTVTAVIESDMAATASLEVGGVISATGVTDIPVVANADGYSDATVSNDAAFNNAVTALTLNAVTGSDFNSATEINVTKLTLIITTNDEQTDTVYVYATE